MVKNNSKDTQDTHPLEPLQEAALLANKKGHENTGDLLEALIQQNEKNNPEPILEATLVQSKKNTDKIVEAIKEKPEVQKMEIVPGENADIATAFFSMLKGKKGDKGDTPTDEELLKLIKPLIPAPIPGKKGDKGDTPTVEQLLALIKPLIPEVKNGETPTDERLLSLIKPLIPAPIKGEPGAPGKPGKNGESISPELIKKVEKAIKDSEKNLLWVNTNAVKSIRAGTNITIDITDPQNPIVSSTGGGGSVGPGTVNQIAYFDTATSIASLSTATYPSLTELTYLKGVTSSIQTQLDAKGAGTVTSVNGTANRITSTGGAAPIIDISATFEALLGKVANRIDQNNAATTSAQLASIISDETGTGALVFANTPTLVTPILGTPTSGDFSSGTFTWPTFNQNTTGYASALKSATTTVDVSAATAPTAGQVLTATDSTHATWQTPSGGGGSPGGSSGQIQYNNAGAFGGDANFTISSGVVTFGKDVVVNTLTLGLGASSIASNAGFGISVLAGITTGNYNLALGYEAMKTVTTGGHNIGIGYQAMYKSTGGGYNTGIGTNALSSITSGSGNHAIGSFCGQTITTGANNVGMGDYALGGNDGIMTSAGSNVAIGPTALGGLSTGSYNIGIGSIAGSAITTGQYNITIGRIAGSSITTGSYNIVIGYNPQVNSGTASNQMSIGNMIYGAGIDGSDTTISTGGIGIGVKVPTSRCDFIGSSTSRASLRILSGTAPTSPNDGDIWFDGTDIKMRIAGATKTFTLI